MVDNNNNLNEYIYLFPEGIDSKHDFLRCYLPVEKEEFEVTAPIVKIYNEKLLEYTGGADVITSYKAALGGILSNDISNIDEVKTRLKVFRYLYHTIGNFIPLPKNTNAGNYTRSSDNFSYKLYSIYCMFAYFGTNKYPADIDPTTLKSCRTEENNKDSTARIRLATWIKEEWVEKRKDWDQFVQKFYLQDFVQRDLIPQFIYGSERSEQRYIPPTDNLELILKALDKCISLIIQRGYRISNDNKEISPNELHDIIDVLKKSTCYKAVLV